MQNYKNMSIKPKVMLIGGIGAGKSSLAACITDSKEEVRKTQTLSYFDSTVDTPGEYLENPFMYKNIISAAAEVDIILFIQDLDQMRCVYPPGMAKIFNRRTIGVITKADGDLRNIRELYYNFKEIGIEEPYFITSAKTGQGIEELKECLFGKGENLEKK